VLKKFLKDFKDESVLKKITNMYFEDFNYLEALTYMFELEKLKPYDMNVKRKLGHLLMTNKDFSEALTRFRLVSANDEAKDDDHINVLRALKATKNSDMARDFVKSLAQTKTLGEDFFINKQSYLQENENDFIRLCPHVKRVNKAHCYYVSGLVYLSNKDSEKAAKSFKKALTFDKKYYKSLYMLGRIYTDYNNQEKKGFKYVMKSLDVEPSYALALNYVAYSWAEKGINLDESLSYSQRALGQEPNNGHYLDTFGFILYRMGEYENALPVLQRAARLIPNNPEVYEHIADVYVGLDKPKKALSFYELASALFKGENLKRLGGKIARFKQNNSRRLGAVTANKSNTDSNAEPPARVPAAFQED
jgi:tetratricopeptide (TPR) repeat protein